MTRIANDRQSHLVLRIWHTEHLAVRRRVERSLPLAAGRLALGSLFDGRSLTRLSGGIGAFLHVEARSERINVEEGILAVVNLGSGHSVHALVARIADGRQVHVGALLRDLDTLEPKQKSTISSETCHDGYLLGVMEVECINNILDFSGLNVVLEQAEVVLAELGGILRRESIFDRVVEALLVLAIDGLGRRLGEALTVEVLTAHLRNITLIARNVLSLDVLVGTANPVLALLRGVTILQLIVLGVLRSQVHVVIVLVKVRLAHGDIDVVS